MRGGTRDDFTHGSDDAPRAAGRLLIVRSVDDVEEARRLLAGARVVGVDVEGVTRRGQPMLPVLLQLGTARAAILIDLLESTDATAAAGKLVAEVLASPAVVKVGVNLVKDVDELFDEAVERGEYCELDIDHLFADERFVREVFFRKPTMNNSTGDDDIPEKCFRPGPGEKKKKKTRKVFRHAPAKKKKKGTKE